MGNRTIKPNYIIMWEGDYSVYNRLSCWIKDNEFYSKELDAIGLIFKPSNNKMYDCWLMITDYNLGLMFAIHHGEHMTLFSTWDKNSATIFRKIESDSAEYWNNPGNR